MGELMVLSVASDTSGCLQLYTTLLSPFRTTVKLYENLEWNSRSCTQNPKLSRTLRLYQAIDFGYELSSPAVLNVKLNWNEDIKAFVKETIFFSLYANYRTIAAYGSQKEVYSDNTLYFYPEKASFDSVLKVFMVFLSSSSQLPGWYCFLPRPFQFTIH